MPSLVSILRILPDTSLLKPRTWSATLGKSTSSGRPRDLSGRRFAGGGVSRGVNAGGTASPAPTLNRLAEQEFDLSVHTPKVGLRPSLEFSPELGIDPE